MNPISAFGNNCFVVTFEDNGTIHVWTNQTATEILAQGRFVGNFTEQYVGTDKNQALATIQTQGLS